MKLRIISVSIICLSLFLAGCKDKTATVITITVKNKALAVQPNIVVYEMEYPSDQELGSNPEYANKMGLTNKQGVATFTLEDYEYDKTKTENNLYYTVLNEAFDGSYEVLGTVAVTFKVGDAISKDLVLK
jgi:hypothetical protein